MTMTRRDVDAAQPILRRAVGLLSLSGGLAGVVVAGVATLRGAVDNDPHGGGTILAMSMLVAAAAGIVFGLLYLRGSRPVLMAFGLIFAAAWHIASGPVLGLVSGTLLLLAGVCALMDAEERHTGV